MATTEAIAQRIRVLLTPRGELEEKRLMGSLAFMVNGAMCCALRDGALLVPPLDVAASVTALYAALFEQSVRESLIRRGPAQAKKFTWERTARLTREAYRRALRAHELLAA